MYPLKDGVVVILRLLDKTDVLKENVHVLTMQPCGCVSWISASQHKLCSSRRTVFWFDPERARRERRKRMLK